MGARIGYRWTMSKRVTLMAFVTGAVCMLSGCDSSSSFCGTTAHGATARAAITSYVRTCGANYSISKGPYDADKATTSYAAYAHVVEYSLNVKSNSEGSLAFLLVGQRAVGTPWQTLGPPGTGP